MQLNNNNKINYDEISLYAHEIKNILAGIMNLAGCIKRNSFSNKTKKNADEIKKAAAACGYMLSLMRGEILSERKEIVSIHSIIESTIHLLPKGNVTVKKNLKAKDLYVYGNLVLLSNAIYNVLLNSAQSTDKKVKISIKTYNKVIESAQNEPVDEVIIIEIEDNGNGVKTDVINRIFEKGFTTKNDGEGMGLYSASVAIKGCGGEIAVGSAHKNGTVFTISLPLQY